jgi:ATP-dependent protease HslVU (ClpYQ) peptidase subunit
MTCIVGYKGKDRVFMGADTAGCDSGQYLHYHRADPKIFRNGDYLVGFTSSFRMGQLLRYAVLPELTLKKMSLYDFMVTKFIPAVRTLFSENGYALISNNQETAGFFLIGVKGQLFEIESDYQVAEYSDPFAAIGCGAELALGALSALDCITNLTIPQRISKALEVSAKYSAYVKPPFNLMDDKTWTLKTIE